MIRYNRPSFLAPILTAALLLGGSTSALANNDVCYSGGSILANFKLNGTANLSSSSIVITRNQGNQGGSAMYQTKFSTTNDFHILMKVKISPGSSSPADGMAFIMHNHSAAANSLGALGGGIGYQGISNSVAVEFDTWRNSELGDPGSPHIALTKDGITNHTSPTNSGLPVVTFASLTPPFNPASGTPFFIWIDYAKTGTKLEVFVSQSATKPATAALTSTINLATTLGSDFYVGFTGSTGGSWSLHEFLELYVTDHAATANGACCANNTDCNGSPFGPQCDPQKNVCGACTFGSATDCASNQGCNISGSHNACETKCDANHGASGTTICGSPAFPACIATGPAAGSCAACGGDSGSGATAPCPAGAPYCASSGYCGLCTINADCTAVGAQHAGAYCNATTGACVSQCTTNSQCGPGNTCSGGSCALACTLDADCGSGNACLQGACVGKATNGAAIPGGACTVELGGRYCASGVCSSNNTCGYRNGEGTCSAGNGSTVCQSGACSASGTCVPSTSGSCYANTDCDPQSFCFRSTFTCTAKLASGTAIPNDGLHGGVCTVGTGEAVCTSGLCNGATNTCANTIGGNCSSDPQCTNNICGGNDKCGRADGTGPCTANNATTVCQSSACSLGLVCMPAQSGACWVDADCTSAQYCNRGTLACEAKLGPGAAIPNDGLHDGGCGAAAAVCEGGLCNPASLTCALAQGALCTTANQCVNNLCGGNGQCGHANGEGPCTSGNAAQVCQSGNCSPAGALCIPSAPGACGVDADCSASMFCDALQFACKEKLLAGSALPADALHDGTCTPSLAQAVCVDGACNAQTNACGKPTGSPCTVASDCANGVCNDSDTCGYARGAGTCTPATAASVCASLSCSAGGACLGASPSGCWVDSDCGAASYCDRQADACKTKLPPGAPLPADGLHQAACGSAVAVAVCDSGLCNPATNTCAATVGSTCTVAAECANDVCAANSRCGHPAGNGVCTPGTVAEVCQTGACGAQSGVCASAEADGCGGSVDCEAGNYCATSNHRCTQKLPVGGALPEGAVCEGGSNVACATGLCNPTTGTCASANTKPCTVASQCVKNACGKDGRCGLSDGQPGCTVETAGVCQTGVCSAAGVCGSAGCVADADCPATAFCDASAGLCKAKLAADSPLPSDGLHDGTCTPAAGSQVCESKSCNVTTNRCALNTGETCSEAAACANNICGSNGTCGIVDGDPGCTAATASLCQSGVCSPGGMRCLPLGADRCAIDDDCTTATFCDGADLRCKPRLPAGAPLPNDPLHGGSCVPGVASAVCQSGLCNAETKTCANSRQAPCTAAQACANNTCDPSGFCGLPNGAGPCDLTSGALICQSGVCSESAAVCRPAEASGCAVQADCIAGQFCNVSSWRCEAKLPAGTPLPEGVCNSAIAALVCADGLCNGVSHTCAGPVGSACTSDAVCGVNLCHSDGICGLPPGTSCISGAQCRAGMCMQGACGDEPTPIDGNFGGGSDCSCSVGKARSGSVPWAWLLAVVAIGALRRRRRPTP